MVRNTMRCISLRYAALEYSSVQIQCNAGSCGSRGLPGVWQLLGGSWSRRRAGEEQGGMAGLVTGGVRALQGSGQEGSGEDLAHTPWIPGGG